MISNDFSNNITCKEKIALISCTKRKKPYKCKASELYSASTLFSYSYKYAKANGYRVFILSAKHRLVDENAILEPYNETLYGQKADVRKKWAQEVLTQLKQVCNIQTTEFIILASQIYCEFLIEQLPGENVSNPLSHLPIGKKLRYFKHKLCNY